MIMKKKYIEKMLCLCLVLCTIFITSCDDGEKGSSQVQLLSFGPSLVDFGDEIKIIGTNLNKVASVAFPVDVEVSSTEFTVHTSDLIVLQVPQATGFGKLKLRTPQGDIESKSVFSPLAEMVLSGIPVEGKQGEDITITGDYLDFVEGVRFSPNILVTDFVSQSRTELVVTVPESALTGKIVLVRTSVIPEVLQVESETDLKVPLPPLAALDVAFYVDQLENGWSKWGGWGSGSSDLNNTENVRDGDKSIKVILDGNWGGSLQLGDGSSSTAGMSKLVLSAFGSDGTNNKELNVIVNGSSTKIIKIVEGKWTEYEINLSDYGDPATITQFSLQNRGWSGTIYVDHIGLRQ